MAVFCAVCANGTWSRPMREVSPRRVIIGQDHCSVRGAHWSSPVTQSSGEPELLPRPQGLLVPDHGQVLPVPPVPDLGPPQTILAGSCLPRKMPRIPLVAVANEARLGCRGRSHGLRPARQPSRGAAVLAGFERARAHTRPGDRHHLMGFLATGGGMALASPQPIARGVVVVRRATAGAVAVGPYAGRWRQAISALALWQVVFAARVHDRTLDQPHIRGVGLRQARQHETPLLPAGFRDTAVSTRRAPEGIRTPDLLIRSQMLYPAELRARVQL